MVRGATTVRIRCREGWSIGARAAAAAAMLLEECLDGSAAGLNLAEGRHRETQRGDGQPRQRREDGAQPVVLRDGALQHRHSRPGHGLCIGAPCRGELGHLGQTQPLLAEPVSHTVLHRDRTISSSRPIKTMINTSLPPPLKNIVIPFGRLLRGQCRGCRSGDYRETQVQLPGHPRVGCRIRGDPVLQLPGQLMQPLHRQ